MCLALLLNCFLNHWSVPPLQLLIIIWILYHLVKYLRQFLCDEWDGSIEDVHEIREAVRIRTLPKLVDVEIIILDHNDGALVLVAVTVIWSRKKRNHLRKVLALPVEHLEALMLHLVRTDDAQQLVLLQKFPGRVLTVDYTAPSGLVVKEIVGGSCVLLADGIASENIAKHPRGGHFLLSLNGGEGANTRKLRAESTVDCKEGLVDNSCYRQGVETLNKAVINLLIVLV